MEQSKQTHIRMLALSALFGPWSIWWAFAAAEAAVVPPLLLALSHFLRRHAEDGGGRVQVG